MSNYLLTAVLLLFTLYGCQTPPPAKKILNTDTLPLIRKSDTNQIEKNNRLIAFVGEMVEVKELPHMPISMDACFSAKYKVLVRVYGHYSRDTIEFTAYDHYGLPEFSKFKNVLLFVSEQDGKYYHEKYQYFDVYKTKDGRWASPYKPGDYEHVYNKNTIVKPTVIEFAERVAYPLGGNAPDGSEYTPAIPPNYYKITRDSAIAIYGNYLEDLFALKRNGVLAASELFDITPEQEEAEVLSHLDEPTGKLTGDDRKFIAFWNVFAASVKAPGLDEFKRIALDSLLVCNNVISTRDFVEKCFREVFDEEVMIRIAKKTGKEYITGEIDFDYLTSPARKEIMKFRNEYRFREALVARSSRNNEPPVVRFDFIETKKGYRLYGIDHSWFKQCCRF